MKGKIIDSHYDEQQHYGYVTKATPYGTFTCFTKVHPSDFDIATAWDGLRFAEMKCDIEAMKVKASRMRQRAIGIENALKTLDSINSSEDFCLLDDFTLNKLEDQMYAAYREANRYKEIYEEMRSAYSFYTQMILDRRRQLREKVNNKSAE